ncbi:glycosyltransferase family 2 protein [Actinomycetes bacterium KLBMP 9797]
MATATLTPIVPRLSGPSETTALISRVRVVRPPADNRTRRIVAVVPAYNEAATIAHTIAALRQQWAPRIDEIVVVPNNCTDDTAGEAARAGATVMEYPGHNPHKKAGALNWSINRLLPMLRDIDFVLVTDADSKLDPDFTQHATRALLRPSIRGHRRRGRPGSPVGAACASFRTELEPSGLLARLQRNEYERFAGQVARRGDKALVLSGVATMFEVSAIKHVISERGQLLPGYGGEFYHRDTATEDIELTFAFRALGYRPMAPASARALTDIMPSRKALRDQRLRWQRGMLDSLRLYGVTRATVGDLARQVGIYGGSLLAPAYLVFLAVVARSYGSVPFSAQWLPLTVLFVAERVWTVRRNRGLDVVMAALLLPEWCYEQWRAGVYWLAMWKTIRGARREWINA